MKSLKKFVINFVIRIVSSYNKFIIWKLLCQMIKKKKKNENVLKSKP